MTDSIGGSISSPLVNADGLPVVAQIAFTNSGLANGVAQQYEWEPSSGSLVYYIFRPSGIPMYDDSSVVATTVTDIGYGRPDASGMVSATMYAPWAAPDAGVIYDMGFSGYGFQIIATLSGVVKNVTTGTLSSTITRTDSVWVPGR